MKQFFLKLMAPHYLITSFLFVIYQVLILFRIGVLSTIAERAGLAHSQLGLIFPTLMFVGEFANIISSYYSYQTMLNRALLFGIIGLTMSCVVFMYFSGFYYIMSARGMIIIIFPFLLILFACISFLILSKFLHIAGEERLIKKTILDFFQELDRHKNSDSSEPKNDRFTIYGISKKSGIDEDSVIYYIKQMIENNEINGHYFKSSRTLVFTHGADMVKFNKLMGD